jgi:TfoX/Sxy family transcriptional regulator of competence genes
MATRQETVDILLRRMAGAGPMAARKMFGEYGLYLDGKLVALVCDDQLFIKPTPGGRAMGGSTDAPPYPGAKPSLRIDPSRWDDARWLADLIATTAKELPAAKPKAKGPSGRSRKER